MGGGGDAGLALVYGVMRARACAVARMPSALQYQASASGVDRNDCDCSRCPCAPPSILQDARRHGSPLLERSAVFHVPLQSVHTVSDLILWLPGSARKNLLNDMELQQHLHSNICDANALFR